ncbi:MAG: hypothetical protein ACLFRH_01495 [Halothiobacillaceae bacterium]
MKGITLQTLTGTLLIGLVVFFWWLPAPELMEVSELDLASQHAGRMGPQKEIGLGLSRFTGAQPIRMSERPYLPLAVFADELFENRAIRVDALEWQSLIIDRAGRPAAEPWRASGLAEYWLPAEDPVFGGTSTGYLSVVGQGDLAFYRYMLQERHDLWGQGVPPAVQFPGRQHLPLMALALMTGMALLWFGRARGLADTSVARGLRFSLALLVLFALLAIYLSTGALDKMDLGYAMMLVAAPVGITTILAVVWLALLLRRLRKLIEGEGLWAHWALSDVQWRDYLQASTARQRGRHLVMLGSLGGIMLAVSLLFLVFAPDREAAGVVVAVMAGVFGLSFLAAWFAPLWTRHRMALVDEPRVWIGQAGALVGNQYFRWSGLGARPRSIQLVPESQALRLIELTFDQVQTYQFQGNPVFYRQEHRHWIPVPVERVDEAQAVVDRLRTHFGLDAL